MASGSSDQPALEGEIVNQAPPVSLTKHPEDTVLLLEAAFNNMFNITEACQYAGISRVTYYEWLADDDIFSYRMSIAQQAPNKKAKENILKALQEGDTNVSKWYLERKDPEFRNKQELIPNPDLINTRDKIKDFLDDDSDLGQTGANAGGAEPPAADTSPAGDEVAPAPTDIS